MAYAAWAVCFAYRLQSEKIRDWPYANRAKTHLLPGGNANQLPTSGLLGHRPTNYGVDWYGVMVQSEFRSAVMRPR